MYSSVMVVVVYGVLLGSLSYFQTKMSNIQLVSERIPFRHLILHICTYSCTCIVSCERVPNPKAQKSLSTTASSLFTTVFYDP